MIECRTCNHQIFENECSVLLRSYDRIDKCPMDIKINVKQKLCNNCKVKKPLDEFYKRSDNKKEYSICIECFHFLRRFGNANG